MLAFKKLLFLSKSIVSAVFIAVFLLILPINVNAASYTWDGGGASENWSDCDNWSTNVCPIAGDSVTFNATSTKNSTIDASAPAAITGITITSAYSGTITLARSFNLTSSYSQAGGTFNSAAQAFDINLVFDLTGGTFTAPSTTMNIGNSISISGSPTFNHNSGNIILDSSGGTYNCNNVTFNLVTLSNTGSQKTMNSTCSFPLGNNPTITGPVVVNGTLSGTGTLTANGTLTFNATGAVTGFSGFNSTANGVVVSGASLDFSSYSSFVMASPLSISSGSLALPSGTDLNSTLTISGGTFTAPSGSMTLAGGLTISGTPIFNANGGTIIMDGPSAVWSCNNVVFNLVQLGASAVAKTVNSNCQLPLGHNPTTSGPVGVVLNGTLSGSGTLDLLPTSSNITLNAGAVLSGFSGITTTNLTVSGATVDFSNYSPVTLRNSFFFTSGTFTAPNLMTVGVAGSTGANFSHSGGTFNANNGTVIFGRDNAQVISGNTTFHNLTKDFTSTTATVNPSLIFTAGTTQTILGTLNLQGRDVPLRLISSATGTQWNIDVQGGRLLNNLTVQDSNNVNSTAMYASNSTDSGNNVNWVFSTQSPLSFEIIGPSDTSYINNQRPTFKWRAATTQAGSNINNYAFQMDNGDLSSNWEVLSIPAYWSTPYITNKYIATYEGFDDTDPSNNYITFTTRSSTDWGQFENDGKVSPGRHSWRVTVFDTLGNSVSQSKNILMDTLAPTVNIYQISGTSFNKKYYITRLKQPILWTRSQDDLNGQPNDNMIASAPSEISISFEKQVIGSLYVPYTTARTGIQRIFWIADDGQVNDNFQNTSGKWALSALYPKTPLLRGYYRVTMNSTDNAGNTSEPQIFYLQVNR